MAISLKTAGTWARVVTDPSSVTIPGTPAAGDRMFLFATWKDFAITVADPTNWTPIGTVFSDGSTPAGNGVGSVSNMVWYRDWESGDANPSLNWSTAPTEAHAVVMLWTKGATQTWDTPVRADAAMTNWTTTPQTCTDNTTTVIPNSSVVMGLIGVRDDSATFTRPTDAIAVNEGTVTWNGNHVESPAANFSSTTGQDMSGDLGYRLVTTGATATLQLKSTALTAAETGAATWIVQAIAPIIGEVNLPITAQLNLNNQLLVAGPSEFVSTVNLTPNGTEIEGGKSPFVSTVNLNLSAGKVQSGEFSFVSTSKFSKSPGLKFASGALIWLTTDVATTIYTISGLEFQPKALRFYWMGLGNSVNAVSQADDSRIGVGFATSVSDRRCVTAFENDASDPTLCTTGYRDDAVVAVVAGTPSFTAMLDIDSITSDGFTLIVDDQLPVSDMTIFWEAWGGDEITVATTGEISEPASIGNVSYSVPGFTADGTGQVVMFAGVQATVVNTAQENDSSFYVGFASGASVTDNIVLMGSSNDGVTTTVTDNYSKTGECLAMMELSGATSVDGRATLNSWQDNAFQLDWLARSVTGRKNIFLAIKGGNWKASSFVINGLTLGSTAIVSDLSFSLLGSCFLCGNNNENVAGTSSTNNAISLGTATNTNNRRSIGHLSETAVSVSQIDLAIRYESIICNPTSAGTHGSVLDIYEWKSDGFSVYLSNLTVESDSSMWVGYLAFGNTYGINSSLLASGQPSFEAKIDILLDSDLIEALEPSTTGRRSLFASWLGNVGVQYSQISFIEGEVVLNVVGYLNPTGTLLESGESILLNQGFLVSDGTAIFSGQANTDISSAVDVNSSLLYSSEIGLINVSSLSTFGQAIMSGVVNYTAVVDLDNFGTVIFSGPTSFVSQVNFNNNSSLIISGASNLPAETLLNLFGSTIISSQVNTDISSAADINGSTLYAGNAGLINISNLSTNGQFVLGSTVDLPSSSSINLVGTSLLSSLTNLPNTIDLSLFGSTIFSGSNSILGRVDLVTDGQIIGLIEGELTLLLATIDLLVNGSIIQWGSVGFESLANLGVFGSISVYSGSLLSGSTSINTNGSILLASNVNTLISSAVDINSSTLYSSNAGIISVSSLSSYGTAIFAGPNSTLSKIELIVEGELVTGFIEGQIVFVSTIDLLINGSVIMWGNSSFANTVNLDGFGSLLLYSGTQLDNNISLNLDNSLLASSQVTLPNDTNLNLGGGLLLYTSTGIPITSSLNSNSSVLFSSPTDLAIRIGLTIASSLISSGHSSIDGTISLNALGSILGNLSIELACIAHLLSDSEIDEFVEVVGDYVLKVFNLTIDTRQEIIKLVKRQINMSRYITTRIDYTGRL